MQKWALQKSNTQGGFTIVELLIVVVVIAILAAITIVAYNGIQERTKTAVVNDTASSWAKVLQMQVTQGAQIPLSASCLGSASSNFPAQDDFLAGECLQVIKNGTKALSVTYQSATLADWKGTDRPPNGLLPVTALTFQTGSDTYVYRARGIWPISMAPAGGVSWVPVIAGQCGPGRSLAVDVGLSLTPGSYGGDICGYGF